MSRRAAVCIPLYNRRSYGSSNCDPFRGEDGQLEAANAKGFKTVEEYFVHSNKCPHRCANIYDYYIECAGTPGSDKTVCGGLRWSLEQYCDVAWDGSSLQCPVKTQFNSRIVAKMEWERVKKSRARVRFKSTEKYLDHVVHFGA